MGIQINGSNDTISASDGGLSISGQSIENANLVLSQNLSVTGIATLGTTVVGSAVTINSTGINVSGITTISNLRSTNANLTGVTTTSSIIVGTAVTINSTGINAPGIGITIANVNDGPLAGFRNFIINGNMAISQRGTSFSTINTYNLDRYRTFGGPITHTITQQDSIATYAPSRYALRAARNSGATETNELGIAQGIESQNSYALRGKTVTVSFRARCGANFSSTSSALLVRVFTGTGTDENPVNMTGQNADISQSVTLTTSLQTFSVTGTLSASLTQATLTFSYTATGTAGANDWFEITDVQLEPGTVATPFERRSTGQELALCQRYFCKTYNTNVAPGTVSKAGSIFVYKNSANEAGFCFQMPVEMRVVPTIVLYSHAGTVNKFTSSTTDQNSTSNGDINGTRAVMSYGSTTIATDCYQHFTCSAEL